MKTGPERLLSLIRDRGGWILRKSRPYWARIAGLCLGIWGSWYGLAAGFLIGFMVDAAREGRLFRARLKDPSSEGSEDLRPGLAAAASLALASEWPCSAGTELRMSLFARLAEEELGLPEVEFRRLGRFLSAASLETGLPLPAFARELASQPSPEARGLLADFAYALQLGEGRELGHREELAIRRILADSGCGRDQIRTARRTAFPAYRDPWEILGLEAGASEREIRKAWKNKGKSLHPDSLAGAGSRGAPRGGAPRGGASAGGAGNQDAAADFRAAREAYDFLRSSRAW